jgi:hypothetical protein
MLFSSSTGHSPDRSRWRTDKTRRRLLAAVIGILAAASLIGGTPPVAAQVLPTPRAFVSNLDLECFGTNPYQPPATNLTLRHLNPALAGLPIEQVTLGPRVQLCVPVAKNNVIPPPDVLAFIRFVDLACYRIIGPTVNQPLALRHLNPVLQNLPGQSIVMGTPAQLCVPVAKNNLNPPAEVLRLISHIDLKCYTITPNNPLNITLNLRQLNPVLGHIPAADVQVRYARQLCVPVQKAGDVIPPEILNIVRWIDLEKFDIIAPTVPTTTLALRHLNPVLGHLPPESATLTTRQQLAVPVAKNGMIPPG